MTASSRRILWPLLVLSALVRPVWSHESEDVARARAHYEIGLGLYQLGNYRDAIKEFAAGYELSPRPKFLINLGQAHRKLNELDRAHELFQQFLAEASPADPDRAQVQQLMEEVDRERARVRAQAPSPRPVTQHDELLPATVAVSAQAATPPHRSAFRRYWWTLPVTIVVAGGAAIGLYFGLRPTPGCSGANLGCVDLRR
jgi:tetratricopeptide (TPR) repeat protein